jgi:glycosyltransferase involved in cell wall biosynthesis
MRIAFIHDWEPDVHQELTWQDGLAAAIGILKTRHQVEFFTVGPKMDLEHPLVGTIHFVPEGGEFLSAVKDSNPDVILHWADMTRPHAAALKTLGKPMAICFAGGNPFGPNWALFDHIFVESNSYLMQYQNVGGVSVSTAFGTNTKLFDPTLPKVKDQAKIFDVCFPATYCDWKRHKLFADSIRGYSAVTSGFMYDDHETYCWEAAQAAGALALPHVSAETLRHIYAASRVCVITSHWTGGSQRTVLEAMAMNIPLVVMADSDKTSEYVVDCGEGLVVQPDPNQIREAVSELIHKPVNTRGYVLGKWSETHYADALEAGLKKLV